MKLNLYSVSDKYIKYLRQFEEKIYDNKEDIRTQTRKYLGIVLTVNDFNYYIPMSSPKKSDYIDYENKIIRKNTKTIIRICNGDRLYGTLRISNMIPVPITELEPYIINDESDLKYKEVILGELRYINNNNWVESVISDWTDSVSVSAGINSAFLSTSSFFATKYTSPFVVFFFSIRFLFSKLSNTTFNFDFMQSVLHDNSPKRNSFPECSFKKDKTISWTSPKSFSFALSLSLLEIESSSLLGSVSLWLSSTLNCTSSRNFNSKAFLKISTAISELP